MHGVFSNKWFTLYVLGTSRAAAIDYMFRQTPGQPWAMHQRWLLLSDIGNFVRWSLALWGSIIFPDEEKFIKTMPIYTKNHNYYVLGVTIILYHVLRHHYCCFTLLPLFAYLLFFKDISYFTLQLSDHCTLLFTFNLLASSSVFTF